jgi:hypothetical protein
VEPTALAMKYLFSGMSAGCCARGRAPGGLERGGDRSVGPDGGRAYARGARSEPPDHVGAVRAHDSPTCSTPGAETTAWDAYP